MSPLGAARLGLGAKWLRFFDGPIMIYLSIYIRYIYLKISLHLFLSFRSINIVFTIIKTIYYIFSSRMFKVLKSGYKWYTFEWEP